MKKLALSLLVACAAVAAVARCNSVYDVTLTMSDAAAARAFECNTDAGFLLTKLAGQPITIVLDVIDMGTNEIVSCRPSEIIDQCSGSPGPCSLSRRRCYTIEITSVTSINDALSQMFTALKQDDAGISKIPTDRTVLVRLVATAEPACPSAALDVDLVGGCAYSCPTKLNASGTLDLDLDTLDQSQCGAAVRYCALFPGP